jgi:hypothetical protein
MFITVNIYDHSNNTPSPDIVCAFNIREIFTNGKWSYQMPETTEFKYNNELIEQLASRKTDVDNAIVTKINEILNSINGRKFVSNPRLKIGYDDILDKPVVIWEAA